jgi:hypothetical protein
VYCTLDCEGGEITCLALMIAEEINNVSCTVDCRGMKITCHAPLIARAPIENVLSSSGTSQLGMFDIQATTKSKYYDHIVLLYLESRRCLIGRLFLFALYFSL